MAHELRIQRKRVSGWKKPDGCVNVTRPGIFGNPFEDAASFEAWLDTGHVNVLKLRHEYIDGGRIQTDRLDSIRKFILRNIEDLRGKQIMCWCPIDSACHGDVIAAIANKEVSRA